MNERMKEPSSEGSWSFKFWGHFECIQWSFRGTEKKNILALFMKESVISLIVDYMWLILTF